MGERRKPGFSSFNPRPSLPRGEATGNIGIKATLTGFQPTPLVTERRSLSQTDP